MPSKLIPGKAYGARDGSQLLESLARCPVGSREW